MPDDERRKSRIEIRVNETEKNAIDEAAAIRLLTVGEYGRRTMLGRKADVRYDMEVARLIAHQIQVIRDLHAVFLEKGIPPSTEVLRPLVDEAIDVLRRLDK